MTTNNDRTIWYLSAYLGFFFLVTQIIYSLFFQSSQLFTIRLPLENNYGNQHLIFQTTLTLIILQLLNHRKIKIELLSGIIWLNIFLVSTVLRFNDHIYYSVDFLLVLLITGCLGIFAYIRNQLLK